MEACERTPVRGSACLLRGGADVIEQNAERWRQLCARSGSEVPFTRPEWISAYVRAFEPDAKIVLAIVEGRDGLAALLPLTERRTLFCGFPVRMLRGPANGHSCRFDAVRAAGEEGNVALRALWNVLKQDAGWDLIELPYVPAGAVADDLLGIAASEGYRIGHYESYSSPWFALGGADSGAAIPRSSHFRQNLRRRIRKAHANWEVRLDGFDRPDPEALRRFYDLEGAGWKGKNRTAIRCSPATRQFYDEIAVAGSAHGYFRLYLLRFGETAVAGHFGLRYGTTYACPKVAYDESYSIYGPGHQMIAGILDHLLPEGLREFDFLGPEMDWKAEWADRTRPHAFAYIFRPGIYGQVLSTVRLHWMKTLRRYVRRYRAYRASSLERSRERGKARQGRNEG